MPLICVVVQGREGLNQRFPSENGLWRFRGRNFVYKRKKIVLSSLSQYE